MQGKTGAHAECAKEDDKDLRGHEQTWGVVDVVSHCVELRALWDVPRAARVETGVTQRQIDEVGRQ